jgi:tRNA pseudouridine13 synthase
LTSIFVIFICRRFTDFLVYEVDLDYNVIHIKSLDIPASSPNKGEDTTSATPVVKATAMEGIEDHDDIDPEPAGDPSDTTPSSTVETYPEKGKSKERKAELTKPWPDRFTTALTPFLSAEAIEHVKTMFLEGPEPPRVSDSGWRGRPARPPETDVPAGSSVPEPTQAEEDTGRRGKDRNGRGGKGGGRGGRAGRREDNRKVLSNVRLLCLLYYSGLLAVI